MNFVKIYIKICLKWSYRAYIWFLAFGSQKYPNFSTKMNFFVQKLELQYQKGWILSKFIKIWLKTIIQGLHLIFYFRESKYPDFCTKMNFFCTKNKNFNIKRDKFSIFDKNIAKYWKFGPRNELKMALLAKNGKN